MLAISLAVFFLRDHLHRFAGLGYLGVFVLGFFTSATVFLPSLGFTVVFAFGSAFHPLGVGLAAGAGAALGEITGYMAGFSGQALVEHRAAYRRVVGWMQRNGFLTICVLAAIPNPAFDLAGMAAGVLRMALWRFLLAAWLGKTAKTLVFAYAGAYSVDWIMRLMR